MKRFILAAAVLALVAADVQAGPIRNLFARFQERRQARQEARYESCQQSAPLQAVAFPSTGLSPAVPSNCPGGRCPIRSSETPTIPEPTVVVFAAPRRMP